MKFLFSNKNQSNKTRHTLKIENKIQDESFENIRKESIEASIVSYDFVLIEDYQSELDAKEWKSLLRNRRFAFQ